MQNIFRTRTTPFKDSLIIISNDGQSRLISLSESLDQSEVQRIDILELIDQNVIITSRSMKCWFCLTVGPGSLEIQVCPILLIFERESRFSEKVIHRFPPKSKKSVIKGLQASRRTFVSSANGRSEDTEPRQRIELFTDSPFQPLLTQPLEMLLETLPVCVPGMVKPQRFHVIHNAHHRPSSIATLTHRFFDVLFAAPNWA